MRLEKKYPLINWVDGMKINHKHFQALEDSLLETIHLNTAIQLPDYGFGLLPSPQSNIDPFGIEITNEQIEIYKCFAITPDGILIQIDRGDIPGLKRSIQDLLHGQQLSAAQNWYVLLRVHAHNRRADGLPDPNEIPLRQPFVAPSYSIELVTEQMMTGVSFLQSSIPLARIIISLENGNRIDESYIPPVCCTQNTTSLYNKYKELEKLLFDIDLALVEIIKKAKHKTNNNKNTSTSDDLLEIASHLSRYLAANIDIYVHQLGQQSPFFLQLWFIRMARVMESSFRYLRDKDNTLNYCEKYSTYEASFLEAGVKQILHLQYNHLNIRPNIEHIERWLISLKSLLGILAGLHYNELGKAGIISPSRLNQKESGFKIGHRSRNTSGSSDNEGWGIE